MTIRPALQEMLNEVFQAEKNGIKIGAYFFSTAVNKDEAVAEANWVKDYIAQYPITYPVGYNCEGFDKESSRQYSLTKDERSSIAEAFLDQIYKAGYTPIFYASMGELAGDAQWNTSQIEKSYKIWMAWYNQNTSNIANGPAYDGQCVMWQYTNQGTVAGISKKVDVDVAYFGYNGTETAKDTSERATATADVEALMSFDTVDETVTAKSSTNLRDKPSQGDDSKVVVTLQNGQTAQRTGISSSGWSRVVFEGSTYYAVSSFLTTDLTAPKQETEQPVTTSGFKTQFADCNETVTAKDMVNLRRCLKLISKCNRLTYTVLLKHMVGRKFKAFDCLIAKLHPRTPPLYFPPHVHKRLTRHFGVHMIFRSAAFKNFSLPFLSRSIKY